MTKNTYEWTLIIIVLLVVAGGVGWIWNLVKIADICCTVTGMLVLRVIGVFIALIGAVLGYF